MTVGILCEKPSAARNFAKALGGMKGTYNGEPYVITNTVGHIFELADPSDQVPAHLAQQYKKWDPNLLPWNSDDFAWKRVKKPKTSDVLKKIKADLTGCSEIVIGTDVDPTGEGCLLAWEVLEHLRLPVKKYSRMYFTDEAAPSIQKAFVNRKEINVPTDPEYVMAWFRTRFDMLSMQWTRIATTYGDGRSVLRQGRLKSAMVQIVGDGLAAVKGYKKIPFYQNRFRDENGVMYTNPDEPMFKTQGEVPGRYNASSVVCDSKQLKKTAPPKLIDLATLSARLAPKGFTANQVLSTYQKMYENMVLSYPRSEDKKITPEQFNQMLPLIDQIAAVVSVDSGLLTHRSPRTTHVAEGMSHGANRPGTVVPASMGAIESEYGKCGAEIYDILAHNFLAMFAEDYEYESQTGHVADYPSFVGSTTVPVSMGWKSVYDDDSDDDTGASRGLGTQASPFVFEGFPPKPPTPTMKWLMAQLAKRNIGTGATRTSTYADVTNAKSKYPLLIDKRGKITMAPCGEMSYRLLPGTHIGSLDLTERVWGQMKEVAAGKADPDALLREVAQLVVEDRAIMEKNGHAMRKELGVSEQSTNYDYVNGTWNGQEKRFKRTFRGHTFTDDEAARLFAGEHLVMTFTSAAGNPYDQEIWLSDDCEFDGRKYFGVKSDFPKASKDKPKCPKSFGGHTFTQDEIDNLEAGCKIYMEGLVSKKTGNTYSATLTLQWQEAQNGFSAGWRIAPEFS